VRIDIFFCTFFSLSDRSTAAIIYATLIPCHSRTDFTGTYNKPNGTCGDQYHGCINQQLPFQFLVNPRNPDDDIYEADSGLLQDLKSSILVIINNKIDYEFDMGGELYRDQEA